MSKAPSAESASLVIVGSGIAGLSAAVTAAEELGDDGTVVLLERWPEAEAGGNTKWTSAYLRLEDVYEPAESFVDEMVDFSAGRSRRSYVEALQAAIPDTMEWIQGHGARFKKMPMYFVNSTRPRLGTIGGGESLRRVLLTAADRLGVSIRYDTLAVGLTTGQHGEVTGVDVEGPEGTRSIAAPRVVIATGGFEGDTDQLSTALDGPVEHLIPVAPGVAANKGEGIRMALDAGAARSGEWDNFHAEPVDPRSKDPEAVIMVFPYGILVNKRSDRFLDEGRGTVDETYEQAARAIWRESDGVAYFITDQQLRDIDGYARGILSSVRPVTAESVPELASALDLDPAGLEKTVTEFNAAVEEGAYDWKRPDGKRTYGLAPDKTNWALPISTPPYIAYPIGCAIVFTFGGVDTDDYGRVLNRAGEHIPGLYAAGECTGIYYEKYPGATSVLRGMIFGRICGRQASTEALRGGTPVDKRHALTKE